MCVCVCFVYCTAALARDFVERVEEAAAMAETSETEKKKRKKKKKKGSKSSNDTTPASDSTPSNADGQQAKEADDLSGTSHTQLTTKNTDPLKTDTDNSSKTESGKDKASELTTAQDGAKRKTESGESSKSDSDTLDRERESSEDGDSDKPGDQTKLAKTRSKKKGCPKEQTAESAVGSASPKLGESLQVTYETKGTSAMKQKTVKKSISCESGGGESEPVAKEEGEVGKDMAFGGDSRKKLHTCGLCGREEVTAKTFKRCQK